MAPPPRTLLPHRGTRPPGRKAPGSPTDSAGAKLQPIRTLRGKAPLRKEPLHWQLYFDVLRALFKADKTNTPSIPALKSQMSVLFHRYMEHHERPAGDTASASAAAANTTFFTYDDENMRLGYLMYRVPRHSVVISKCLGAGHEHIHRLLTRAAGEGRPFVVASFGGGPSSDLFGFLSYLDTGPFQGLPIVFHIFDMGPWAPFWTHIALALPRYYPSVEVHFHTADLADPKSASLVPPETQLLLFSYFIVEMTPFADGFTAFFTALVAAVRPDALFVVMDSHNESAVALRERLTAAAGLKVVLENSDRQHLSYLCIIPQGGRVYDLLWLKATMSPHVHIWQAKRDHGGRAEVVTDDAPLLDPTHSPAPAPPPLPSTAPAVPSTLNDPASEDSV